jgi:beta-glucosidase/6-phospho-beta-glucosidase/beta-galactosidase
VSLVLSDLVLWRVFCKFLKLPTKTCYTTDPWGGLAAKMQEDVRLMKDMGMDAYRFSISWTRILPSK